MQRLLIFTRNPVLGKVKTRLAKSIGEEQALEVYKLLLMHTHQVTKGLPLEKVVYYSDEVWEDDIWAEGDYLKMPQQGKDLGERMQSAFQEAFATGCHKVVVIGSDLTHLKQKHLVKAFKALDTHEAVLGPATDGGYYLLGMNHLIPSVFAEKTWGTSKVLQATLLDLKDKSVHLLEPLNDIDTYEDLKETHLLQKITNHTK